MRGDQVLHADPFGSALRVLLLRALGKVADEVCVLRLNRNAWLPTGLQVLHLGVDGLTLRVTVGM